MDERGRRTSQRGVKNNAARFIEAQIIDIRRRVASGEKQLALAIEYGTRQSAISQIVRRKIWADIDDGTSITDFNSTRKLTEDQVREIRRRSDLGESRVSLGREFGVVASTISTIARRETWDDVPETETPEGWLLKWPAPSIEDQAQAEQETPS